MDVIYQKNREKGRIKNTEQTEKPQGETVKIKMKKWIQRGEKEKMKIFTLKRIGLKS